MRVKIKARSEQDAFRQVLEEYPSAGGYELLSRRNKDGHFSSWGHTFYFQLITELDLGEEEY